MYFYNLLEQLNVLANSQNRCHIGLLQCSGFLTLLSLVVDSCFPYPSFMDLMRPQLPRCRTSLLMASHVRKTWYGFHFLKFDFPPFKKNFLPIAESNWGVILFRIRIIFNGGSISILKAYSNQ